MTKQERIAGSETPCPLCGECQIAGEVWVPVRGSPGFEVSDQGRIKALPTTKLRGGLLRQTASGPYLYVYIGFEGRRTSRLVHTVVLESFVGPRPHGHEGAHANGNPHDNRLANLRWATATENAADRAEHGRHKRSMMTRRFLTDAEVETIRSNYLVKPQAALAAELSVSVSTIQKIHRKHRQSLERAV
jgi:DNA-binding transcriptional regulator YiaG